MAKFKVQVKIVAAFEYEVEVEASSEHDAEDIATGMWREMTPDDFQVSKGYITDWEVEDTEQLTHTCERCEREYPANVETATPWAVYSPKPLMPWQEDSDFCADCGVEIEAEEKAEAEQRAQRRAAR